MFSTNTMWINFAQTITAFLIRCGWFSACCHLFVYTQYMQFSTYCNSSFSQQRVCFSAHLLLLQKAVILDMFDYYFHQQWTTLAICFPELWMWFSTCHHCSHHQIKKWWAKYKVSLCCHCLLNKQWMDFYKCSHCCFTKSGCGFPHVVTTLFQTTIVVVFHVFSQHI